MSCFLKARSLPSRQLFPIWRRTSFLRSLQTSTNGRLKRSNSNQSPQAYPLLPSVEHLIHKHHLDASTIAKINPTGPNNRLLKGDILAFLGSVSSSYPQELSAKIEKLSHLDLSNIKLAPPAPAPNPATAVKSEVTKAPEAVEVATTISMKPVIEIQTRIQNSLGIFMPLSTFVARATDIANNNLPRAETDLLSANELFDQILGLEGTLGSNGVRGRFAPEITAVSPPMKRAEIPKVARTEDLIDVLSGRSPPRSKDGRAWLGGSDSVNRVSLRVHKSDERRGNLFLERLKSLLEADPGRLVL